MHPTTNATTLHDPTSTQYTSTLQWTNSALLACPADDASKRTSDNTLPTDSSTETPNADLLSLTTQDTPTSKDIDNQTESLEPTMETDTLAPAEDGNIYTDPSG